MTAPGPGPGPRTLHVLRPGTGMPLVLLHAFPLDARMWTEVAAVFADPAGTAPDVPVLAVDLPGMGTAAASALPEPSIEAAADVVAAVLAAAGHARVVVAGLSMGGYVAMALAERHPGLLAGIGLLDTKSTADAPAARANRLRVADAVQRSGTVDEVAPMASALLGATSRARRPELAARIAGWIGAQQPSGVAWSQRAMAARPDRTAVLAACGLPALVLVGDEDEQTPLPEAEHLAQALAVRPQIVPAAGHLSAVEAPDVVSQALAGLVQRAADRV
ncbi:MAG TPA: alpha/beta hydrolase [Cellulomonas sp.]